MKLRANEPKFVGDPECPDWLSEYGKEVWNRVIPDLIEQGVTKRVDQDSLCAYCEAVADLRTATEVLGRDGVTVQGRSGPVKHPAVSMKHGAMVAIARYAAEFGLTGASRSKVKADRKTDENGKSRFFGGEAAPA